MQSTNTQKVVIACPECKHTHFVEDKIHDEVVCRHCGLVVKAPPVCGLVFPGVVVVKVKS